MHYSRFPSDIPTYSRFPSDIPPHLRSPEEDGKAVDTHVDGAEHEDEGRDLADVDGGQLSGVQVSLGSERKHTNGQAGDGDGQAVPSRRSGYKRIGRMRLRKAMSLTKGKTAGAHLSHWRKTRSLPKCWAGSTRICSQGTYLRHQEDLPDDLPNAKSAHCK